jgi:ketosteroid isomerase-like protein
MAASAVSETERRALFAGLFSGTGESFFARMADDVDWTVEGTHPLAGHYCSKWDFLARTCAKLHEALVGGASAVDELRSMVAARNGMRFDSHYCWVTHFADGVIVEVRAHLDSALVQRLVDENPLPRGS